MIIEEIKKASLQALKEKDAIARSIYSIIINKYSTKEIDNKSLNKPNEDSDMLNIISKTTKELLEEKDNYIKAGNKKQADVIEYQKSLIEKYLPEMMGDEKIRKIIDGLEDKSISSIMKHFKDNYNGKCEMSAVSKIARQL